MHVGQEIRQLREAKGWSQAKLAAAADMAVSGVSQIETGARNPSAVTLAKIADALEVEVADLFPKDQARLPFERDDLQQRAISSDFVALVETLDDEQLAQLREWLKAERIQLGVRHHDNPDDRATKARFARAVERLMYAGFEIVGRAQEREAEHEAQSDEAISSNHA
jgi:transcriptional regulator with XRE-family HTH domain